MADSENKLSLGVRLAGGLIIIAMMIGAAAPQLPALIRIARMRTGGATGDALVAAARSSELHDRAAAAAGLAKKTGPITPDEAPGVCYLLDDPDSEVSEDVKVLVTTTRKPAPSVISQAAAALAQESDTDSLAAAMAAYSVVGPQTADDVAACIAAFSSDDARTRHLAAVALHAAPTDNADVLGGLVSGLKNRNPYIRQNIAMAIKDAGPALVPHARAIITQAAREDYTVRRHLVGTYKSAGPGFVPELIRAWNAATDNDLRAEFARGIQSNGKAAAKYAGDVLPHLTGNDREKARSAAEILADIDPRKLDSALASQISSSSDSRKAFAIEAYSLIPDQARRRLRGFQSLLKDDSPQVRRATLDTLLAIDPDNSADYLSAMARDPDPELRNYVKDLRANPM